MIYDKPFVFSEMLRRTIFKGRPNFFNAKDFNKELLIIHSFIEEFNKVFAVWSNVEFTIPSFTETYNSGTNTWARVMNVNWTGGEVMYKGVKFQILPSGTSGYSHVYPAPNTSISPKQVKPPTYIVLTADLNTIDYSLDPVLCGIQSTTIPSTVPTVDVEQYKNLQIKITHDPTLSSLGNVICVLGTIHPKYKPDGSDDGFGFLYNTFKNDLFTLKNGYDNQYSNFKCNNSIFEYIVEKVITSADNVLNERQLVRRFHLADLADTSKARHNIGLNKLVNHRQLVQAENLADLTDKPLARYNLGLGSSATANIGYSGTDVAPGNILPIGAICMWSGAPSAIPTGWVLCDGSNGTPDLRGRFVVGLNSADPEFNLMDKTGGSKTVSIQKQHLPKYDLLVTDDHKHDWWERYNSPNNGGNMGQGYATNHTHQYEESNKKTTTKTEGNIVVNLDGGEQDLQVLPPYYTLCYMMYKGATLTPPPPPTIPPPLVYPNFSVPTTGVSGTDGGYSTYTPVTVGGGSGATVGSGITLTNPE